MFLNSATDYVKFNISLQKHLSPGTMPLTYRYYEGRNISNSGTAQTIAKPERLKPRPIGKCIFNSGNDYVKFSISLHKQSSPGTVRLTNYKRRHISASGTAQTVAKPARLKLIGKCSFSTSQFWILRRCTLEICDFLHCKICSHSLKSSYDGIKLVQQGFQPTCIRSSYIDKYTCNFNFIM